MFDKCVTGVSRLFHQFFTSNFTSVLPVSYPYFISVSPVWRQFFTSVSPIFTNVSQVFYLCFNYVSPVFHLCFIFVSSVFHHCFNSVPKIVSKMFVFHCSYPSIRRACFNYDILLFLRKQGFNGDLKYFASS